MMDLVMHSYDTLMLSNTTFDLSETHYSFFPFMGSSSVKFSHFFVIL